MANFEKTLKQKFNSIKDFTVRKYTLEYFYDKLSQLTPITNFKKKDFKFSLKPKPLKQTKDLLLKKIIQNLIQTKFHLNWFSVKNVF